jgi:hypothetical protein
MTRLAHLMAHEPAAGPTISMCLAAYDFSLRSSFLAFSAICGSLSLT